GHAENDVRLLRLLRVDDDAAVRVRGGRLGLAGLPVCEVTEQLLRALHEPVPDAAGHAEHYARGLVPPVEIAGEGVARRGADRLLGADDVPAERLVAPEESLVDTADEVARRVEVHVHLFDDHALLALDLLLLE